MENEDFVYEWEINSKTTWLGSSFKELYWYKDLLFRLVRKDILLQYQQTMFGPLWVLLQPLLTVFTFVVVFNRVLRLPTGNVPPLLYYLSGILLWNLFMEVLLNTASTFTKNVQIFGKVYFPRIIVPMSIVLLNWFQFAIQFLFLWLMIGYYCLSGKVQLNASGVLLCVPIVAVVSGIALGTGLIFSILTTKYRDLSAFLPIVVRLLMFICPVLYSVSSVPENIRWLVQLNPLSVQFEAFRYALLKTGDFSIVEFTASVILMLVLVTAGLLLFNKKGDRLIDVA